VFDYTADGVRRSIEDSLQRMGVSRLDIALVTTSRPTTNCCRPSTSRSRAFPALSRMREEGIIKGWGIGVNTPEPILRVMQEGEPDACMLASQYSLTDHANALNNVFPLARQRNVKFVIGSSLNAGFISGSPRYNYGKTSWSIPAGTSRSGRGCALWRRISAPIYEPLRFTLCVAGRRRGVDRRRAYRGASPRQCELHAGDDPAGV
jgi:D-threo-aldose 1-dehydrogenase